MKAPTLHLPAPLPALLTSLGPYAALALLLPGGSLIALVLLAVRHLTHREVRS
jgi:hypothetical protein